jgi:N utilization substance protein A
MLSVERQELATAENPMLDEKLQVEGMNQLIVESLISAGFDTARKVLSATPEQLSAIPEISLDMAYKILEEVRKKKGAKVG